MRAVAEVNKYVTDTEPWKLKGEDQRERLGTVLHVVAQCVADLNMILSPFLPLLGQRGRRGARRRRATCSRCPSWWRSTTSTAVPGYPILTGDYSAAARWERRPIVVGHPVAKPTPVFTKLDPTVVDEELARLAPS